MPKQINRCSGCGRRYRRRRVNNNLIDIAVTAALRRLEIVVYKGVEKILPLRKASYRAEATA